MITQSLHRLYSLPQKIMLILLLRNLPKEFKMRKDVKFLLLNQIMGANFKMKDLINSVRSKESSTTFLHQELHNKMDWWRERIDHWRNWPGRC